jgi:hypothetical protein|tara:strand:- start:121 stop:312 length:192 start_codon:yes stop_codon:yes gene_type:complete
MTKKILINTSLQAPMQIDEKGDTLRQMFGSEKKGVIICIAKKCNAPLYKNQSTSDPKYCMRCA